MYLMFLGDNESARPEDNKSRIAAIAAAISRNPAVIASCTALDLSEDPQLCVGGILCIPDVLVKKLIAENIGKITFTGKDLNLNNHYRFQQQSQ